MYPKPRTTQILGALWGAVVGDALGVPVEFLDRSELRRKPVTDVRGFGTPDATSPPHFELLTSGKLTNQSEDAISSAGYVIDTLTASIWCRLTSTNYTQAVLRTVNLGSDTDTTATVTGGLAGLFYGLEAVPDKWRAVLARRKELEKLFANFTKLTEQT